MAFRFYTFKPTTKPEPHRTFATGICNVCKHSFSELELKPIDVLQHLFDHARERKKKRTK